MKNNDSNMYIWAGLIICVGIGFIFFAGRRDPSTDNSGVTFSQVDNARKDLMIRKKIQSDKVQVENYRNAPNLDTQYRPVKEDNGAPVGLQLESATNHAAADSGDNASATTNGSLDFQINKTLMNQQRAAQMSAMQKQQFVEDYKRKALAMGYEVEINSKLEITKVRKAGNNRGLSGMGVGTNPSASSGGNPGTAIPIDVNQIEEEEEEEAE